MTALLENSKDDIELVYKNSYKKHCYFLLICLMVDYEKPVVIIDIKANM